MTSHTFRLVGLSLSLVLASACSSTKTIESASAPPASVIDSVLDTVLDTVPVTTPVPTDPPVTEPPVTVPPPQLVLRNDGLELVSFGAGQAEVLTALSALLGSTVSDDFLDFPVDNGSGFLESVDGDIGFAFSAARHSCFNNDFCVTFGGTTPDSASFVGWSFRGSPDPAAPTTDVGITIGSRQSDFPDAITAFEGGCFTVGGGETPDGIFLTLISDGTPFFSFDDTGNPVNQTPDPSEVSVMAMEAGLQLLDLIGDC